MLYLARSANPVFAIVSYQAGWFPTLFRHCGGQPRVLRSFDLKIRGGESEVDQFEDQYIGDAAEPLGIPFDDDAAFSIRKSRTPKIHKLRLRRIDLYGRPVRVYLREMGAVPLLTRDGEVTSPAKWSAVSSGCRIDQPVAARPADRCRNRGQHQA